MNKSEDSFKAYTLDEAYRMSMAEFRGATLASLKSIDENIKSLQAGQSNLQNQLNGQKLLAAVIGGFAGVITGIITAFRK